MTEPRTIVEAVTPPITLLEAREHCRIDVTGTDVDETLEAMVAAATQYVESYAGITIHQKTLEVTLDGWPCCGHICLPRATPLIAIVSITTKDHEGTTSTASGYYLADTDSKIGRVVTSYGQSWPGFTPYPVSPIRIRYTAGIQTASPVTEASAIIKHAIKLIVGGLWEHREDFMLPDRAGVADLVKNPALDVFLGVIKAEYAF